MAFIHHWLGFADLLREPILWDSFGENALLQGGYILVFGALAYGRFATKDILSLNCPRVLDARPHPGK